jgi:hypothetical protein
MVKKKSEEKKSGNHLKRKDRELLINEVELLLSEKRTSLATMRTGIGLLPIPLSIFMIIIAIYAQYEPVNFMFAIILIAIFCIGLVMLGVYLIVAALKKIHYYDNKVDDLKKRDEEVKELVD